MKFPIVAALATTTFLSFTQGAFAHGGALDRSGCHFDSRTKVYHCHKGPRAFDNSASDRPATKSVLKSKRR